MEQQQHFQISASPTEHGRKSHAGFAERGGGAEVVERKSAAEGLDDDGAAAAAAGKASSSDAETGAVPRSITLLGGISFIVGSIIGTSLCQHGTSCRTEFSCAWA